MAQPLQFAWCWGFQRPSSGRKRRRACIFETGGVISETGFKLDPVGHPIRQTIRKRLVEKAADQHGERHAFDGTLGDSPLPFPRSKRKTDKSLSLSMRAHRWAGF